MSRILPKIHSALKESLILLLFYVTLHSTTKLFLSFKRKELVGKKGH